MFSLPSGLSAPKLGPLPGQTMPKRQRQKEVSPKRKPQKQASPKQNRQKEISLTDLRRDIDRIDASMHALLIERGEIIDRLIAVKKTQDSGSAFRPAREADMMKRLGGGHHRGAPLPPRRADL